MALDVCQFGHNVQSEPPPPPLRLPGCCTIESSHIVRNGSRTAPHIQIALLIPLVDNRIELDILCGNLSLSPLQ